MAWIRVVATWRMKGKLLYLSSQHDLTWKRKHLLAHSTPSLLPIHSVLSCFKCYFGHLHCRRRGGVIHQAPLYQKELYISLHQSEGLEFCERKQKSPLSNVLRLHSGSILHDLDFSAAVQWMLFCREEISLQTLFRWDLSYTVGYWSNSDIIGMHETENHNGDEKQKDKKTWCRKEQC